jgi:hypothetical protein
MKIKNDTQPIPNSQLRPAVVYRQVALSVEAFDCLKDWQRHWEATEGCRYTNGVLLDRLILSQRPPRPAR